MFMAIRARVYVSVICLISAPVFSSVPTSSLVGSTAGSFGVSPSGAATYSLPISVPPGSAGIAPKLSLGYNSQGGNGLLGVGWSLNGLSSITRCPTTLEQDGFIDGVDFDSNDKFCMGGQRLVAVSGTYGANGTEYRTEYESFSKVISYGVAGSGPAYFRVWGKDGSISEYGVTTDSRIEAQGKSHAIVWAVNRVEDVFGNFYEVNYTEDTASSTYRPLSINYTGNESTGLSPNNAVIFEYEHRWDQVASFVQGTSFNLPVRLSRVKTYNLSTMVREYQLAYSDLPLTQLSRLDTITECVLGVCLPSTQASYPLGSNNGQYLSGNYNVLVSSGYATNWRMTSGDVNGDGLIDKIAYYIGQGVGQGVHMRPLLSNGDGTYTASTYSAPATTGYGVGWRMTTGDVNGDGLTDMIAYYIGQGAGQGVHIVPYISNGDGTFTTGTYNAPFIAGYGVGWDITTGDSNGDGRTDLIAHYIGSSANNGMHIVPFTSNGNGTFSPGTYNAIATTGYATGWKIAPGDANGDGLTDMVAYYIGNNAGIHIVPVFSNGDGSYIAGTWNAIESVGYGAGWKMMPTDANGDGLTDMTAYYIGQNRGIHVRSLMSKGDGTFTPGTYNTIATTGYGVGWKMTSGDSNGDGYSDLIAYYTGQNNGAYIVPILSQGDASYISGQWNTLSSTGYGTYWDMMPSDADGDGLTDMVAFHIGSSANNGIHMAAFFSRSESPQKLSSITNGVESGVSFKYGLLTQDSTYAKAGDSVYPVIDVRNTRNVVTQLDSDDGIGGTKSTSYKYEGLKVHLTRRESLGFQKVTATDSQTVISSTTEYYQSFPFSGYPKKTEQRLANDSLLSTVENTPTENAITHSNGEMTYAPYIATSVGKQYHLDNITGTTSLKTTATTHTTQDDYGNPLTVDVTTVGNGGTFTQNTVNTYNNDTGNWFLGQLLRTTGTSQSPNELPLSRAAAFEYDAVSGLLTKEVIEPDAADPQLRLTTVYTHDAFGNRLTTAVCDGTVTGCSIASPEARTSTVVYDDSGRFVVQGLNALGHSGTQIIDARFGVPSSSTAINGLVTNWDYDSLGRMTKETRADGTETTVTRQWCDVSANCPSQAYYKITTLTTGEAALITYFDQQQREVRREKAGFDGTAIYIDTEYDSRGRVKRSSEPYFAGAGAIYWTTPNYDVLNRVVAVSYPHDDGSLLTAATEYQAFSVITTDAKGRNNVKTFDAVGQLLTVTDTDLNTLSYRYDSHGQLLETTDPANNVVALSYNIRGQKTAMNDPDMGLWSYGYNAFGELVSQTDAKNQTTTMAYDKLGRMTARTDLAGTATPLISTWTYDNAVGNGVGQLASMQAPADSSKTFSYDVLGRPASTTYHIKSEAFTVTQDYDLTTGWPSSMTYPASAAHASGLTVKKIYNTQGYLEKVQQDGGTVYWQANSRTARGQVSSATYGNGLLGFNAFSPANGSLGAIQTVTMLTEVLQQNSYSFDEVGNLTSRIDERQGFTESFDYDNLDRMTASGLTGVPSGAGYSNKTVSYDVLGNITHKSDVGSYTYDNCSAGPHAACQAGAKSYTFDANGSSVSGDGRTITYSAFNKPVHLSKGGDWVSYTYGADRSRVFKEASSSSRHTRSYFVGLGATGGMLFEREVNQNTAVISDRHYIYAEGSNPVAVYTVEANTTKTEYYHRDQLGSVELITDQNGAVSQRSGFDAWGKSRYSDWQDDPLGPFDTMKALMTFTGHENISEMGLIHMNGRIFDPVLGRFLSADPNITDPMNLQNYNRYSYVLNNPLRYTDPSGYDIHNVPIDNITITASFTGGGGFDSSFFDFGGFADFGSFADFGDGFTYDIDLGDFEFDVKDQPPKKEPDQKPEGNACNDAGNSCTVTDTVFQNGTQTIVRLSREDNRTTNTAVLYAQGGLANGYSVLSNLTNGSGLFSSAALLNFLSNDGLQWKGKNGKWNRIGWGGNGSTGARSEIIRRANKIKAAGQGFFVLGTSLSLYEGANAFSNGNAFGVLKSGVDIGWGTAASFGGGVGLAGGGAYYLTSLLQNIPAFRDSTVTPLTNGLCYVSGNC